MAFTLVAVSSSDSRTSYRALSSVLLTPLSLTLPLIILALFSSCNDPTPPDSIIGCSEDITSHEFVWSVDSLVTDLGAPLAGISELRDMAVISENDVWLVGQFFAPETSQSVSEGSFQKFNSIHWDGNQWEYDRLLGQTSSDTLLYSKLKAIHAFASDDVWVLFAGAYAHWDGNSWASEFIWEGGTGTFIDIWGTSSTDLYFTRSDGFITHFDGQTSTKLYTGFSIPIRHIHGKDNDQVWAIAHNNTGAGIENGLIKYDQNGWLELHHQNDWQENWPPEDYTKPSGTYLTTWAYGDTLYLGCASLWKESISTGEGHLMHLDQLDWNLAYGLGTVAGNHCNDIFAFMAVGLGMTHYNGANWQRDTELQAFDPGRNLDIRAVEIKNDIVFIAVEDFTTGYAVVIRGNR